MDAPTALADPVRDAQVGTLPPPDPDTAATGHRRAGGRTLPNIPGLDGLRALAVIAVLLYHAGVTWIPGGFLGVEVFFVVSGYLITSLLMRERQRSGRVSLRNFWVRRARRLLPALLVMIAVVVVVWTFFVREQLAKLRGDVIASLLYVENWHLIASGQSYFDDFLRPSPLRHVWSLAVEEQFYLLWPLMVVVLAAVTRLRRRPMIGAMVAGALASYVLMQVLYTPGGDPSRVYYGTDTRASALLLGGALALWWAPDRSRSALRGRTRQVGLEVVGLAGVALLALLFATTHDTSSFLYRAGFMLCTVATMGVVATSVRPTWVGRVLGVRPLRWVGLRSYGLYLWHWPIFVLTRPVLDLDWQWWKIFVLRMVLTVFLAGLSYRWVESPARRGGISAWLRSLKGPSARAGRRRARTVVGLGVALAVLVPATVVLARAQPVTTQLEASIDEGADVVARQAPLTAAPSAPRRISPAADRAPATAATTVATTLPSVSTSGPATPDGATTVAPPVPETTAVAAATLPATVPTTIPAGPTILIGDSVMLGAAGTLVNTLGPTTYVDAEVSRAFVRGIEIARSLRDQGLLGPVVVVHLGDNGPIREGEFEQMMEALAAVPRVLFVTVKVPRGWEEAVNLRLVEKVPSYPNARLVDWYGYSVNHPEWFYEDGIHLNPTGREAYAQLIAGSLAS